jgi:hypothetical protein
MTRSPDPAPSRSRPYTRRAPASGNQYLNNPDPEDAREFYPKATRLRMDARFSHAMEAAIATDRERRPPRRR